MLTIKQLELYAEKFLKDNYNLKLEIPIKLNGRMTRACGYFRSIYYKKTGKEVALSIDLNKTFVTYNDVNVVIDVLAHELVHYALFLQGKPNDDGHPYFENELKRLKIVSQNTINKYTIMSKKNIYTCEECDKVFRTNRALSNNGVNHRCQCGGRLNYNGKKLVAN